MPFRPVQTVNLQVLVRVQASFNKLLPGAVYSSWLWVCNIPQHNCQVTKNVVWAKSLPEHNTSRTTSYLSSQQELTHVLDDVLLRPRQNINEVPN